MANVDITINNHTYKVSCDDGQEQRLQKLAAWADERVQMIASELGQIGDTRLMLLSMLMVCDELFELREHHEELKTILQKDGKLIIETTPDRDDHGAAQNALEHARHHIQSLTERLANI